MKRREVFDQQQNERNAWAERIKWERDSEARIEDAKQAGFVVGAKVRRSLKPDSEIGEIVGYTNYDRAMVIKVRFKEDEFPYAAVELELIED